MKDSKNISMKEFFNKVPEITLYFWIIKILCTTVGETAADFLNVNLNLGLTITSIIMGVLLIISLIFQFKANKYVPSIYWINVFLISIFGTLVTDNLTDGLGVSLVLSTIVFSFLLAITFFVWYRIERTLSIHSIDNLKRESFYWVAILFTFALGTAAGDLIAEGLGLGYLVTGIIVAVMILSVTFLWKLKFNSVLTFWVAYILTRPLGASIGDYLSQSTANGGLGLGPSMTTIIFVLAIILTVIYLSITKKDQMRKDKTSVHEKIEKDERKNLFLQIMGLVILLLVIASVGYFIRHTQQQNTNPITPSSDSPLGDLSQFKKITSDTLILVKTNNLEEAKTRITDLETLWDDSQSQLKPLSPNDWSNLDDQIDKVLRQIRAINQDKAGCETALTSLIDMFNSVDKAPQIEN